jgi:thiamine biosynthesis lipoprotein
MSTRRVLVPAEVRDDAPSARSIVHTCGGLTMGTSWMVKVAAPAATLPHDLTPSLQRELDLVVAQMSHWDPDSDLCRFNRAPAGTWCELPEPFYSVLSYALGAAKQSDGAFDPTAGALVDAWGFGPAARFDQVGFLPPAPSALAGLTQTRRARWSDIQLDGARRRALQPGGAQLDFSAVAKGYAVDRLAGQLQRAGLRHFLVEVGGELRGAGMKPDQQPWWVELEQPGPAVNDAAPAPTQTLAPAPLLALHGLAVATSGDYRRYFEYGGQRFAHTIDPRTGWPLRNGVASVTVIHAQCMAADALSTALGVLGVADGLRFAHQHQLAARFICREGAGFVEHLSPAFEALLDEA